MVDGVEFKLIWNEHEKSTIHTSPSLRAMALDMPVPLWHQTTAGQRETTRLATDAPGNGLRLPGTNR